MSKAATRRIVVWGGIGLVGLVILLIALIPGAETVDVATVARGPLMVTLDHEGMTRAREPFEISAPVAGRVLRIELEPGDPVQADRTVLATFQPSEPILLDDRSRAEAEARLRAAREQLERARAERDRARAQSDLAASELERVHNLEERGIVSRQNLDSAEADARAAAESFAAAEAAARSARHDVEQAAAALMEPGPDSGNPGRRRSTTLSIRSPVDGVVLRRLRQSEAVVAAGETLLEVADLSDLEVAADFLSTDAVKMRPGMRVLIDRWGGDHPLEGRLRRVEPSGFMKISALGVEEQRVWVLVDFDDPRGAWQALGDGYRVEARVVVYDTGDALTIPTGSLFRHGDSWASYAVRGGRARLVELEIGQRNELEAEVLSGLGEGDRVIVHPPDGVADGSRVTARSDGS